MKATKKPIEIDYYYPAGKYLNEIQKWSTKERPIEISCNENVDLYTIKITTLEGVMTSNQDSDDVIIKGINGEVYLIKKEIFDKTYTVKYMEKSHEYKTLENFSHDYRDMAMSEDDLMNMLESFAEALNCKHECTSSCRKNGCNCACGKFHF